jgi:hypothetical protein
MDPEPLPDLTGVQRRYWASGDSMATSTVSLLQSVPNVLAVRGVFVDYIQELGAAWCPDAHLVPIPRRGVTILESWEELALKPVSNCPYINHAGREDAFWRTNIADFAGDGRAPSDDHAYFESWCDHTG